MKKELRSFSLSLLIFLVPESNFLSRTTLSLLFSVFTHLLLPSDTDKPLFLSPFREGREKPPKSVHKPILRRVASLPV